MTKTRMMGRPTATFEKNARLEESRAKILPPFELDPSLRFYSPQENVDAFNHPVIQRFHRFMLREYEPELPAGRATALLLPCTKTKPYPFSLEHRRINAALLRAGFGPYLGAEDLVPPPPMLENLGEDEPEAVTFVGPLRRRRRILHRYVLSEPMALVPYEFVYRWRGRPSPASRYDDPGLFEHRGTSVSPWHPGHTARLLPSGRWAWGEGERAAYVEAHNHLSEIIAQALQRLRSRYERIVAWVAPGLTHRSFLLSQGEREAEGVPIYRAASSRRLRLIGVNDRVPGLVAVHPTRSELEEIRRRLAARLADERPGVSGRSVNATYARGAGAGSPLGLPEALAVLVGLLADPTRRKG